MLNSNSKKFWDSIKKALYFPKITLIGIPALIFFSLFFVPESFLGLTKSSKTMEGTYKNKWLFDMIYIASTLAFINLHLFKFFRKDYTVSKEITNIFQFGGNPAYIKFIFYFVYFMYFLSMNMEASNSTKFLMEYNRISYINFFIYIFLFYYIFIVLGFIVLPTKEDKL